MNLYVGVDISKGYADFCVTDGERIVREEHRLDDTRSGHDQAQELARERNGLRRRRASGWNGSHGRTGAKLASPLRTDRR